MVPPVKKIGTLTSYGGIIRIRLRVEGGPFLSARRYELPCILLSGVLYAKRRKKARHFSKWPWANTA